MVYMHAHVNTLLLLHSTFMLSVVKMPVKGEVGSHVLNSHRNFIVDHGKSWNCVFEFLWKPCSMQTKYGHARKNWLVSDFHIYAIDNQLLM